MISCIYKITCLPTGKIYVGSTIHYYKRMSDHFKMLMAQTHKNSHLQSAYNKYGHSAFYMEVIELVEDKGDLLFREKYWMDTIRAYDKGVGFNICITPASSLGVKRSEDFKNKVRMANMARSPEIRKKTIEAVKSANIGRKSWNKGVKMWATRKHPKGCLGKKFPNKKLPPGWYQNICAANSKPRGEEYLKKRSVISEKAYYFIDPVTGCELKIWNLSEFCKNNGLNKSRMYQVAKGNEAHHRGWTRDEDCYIELISEAA